jgi:hypothetical protein
MSDSPAYQTAFRGLPSKVLQQDWAALSPDEQHAYFVKNGFLVIPGAFGPEELQEMRREIEAHRPFSSVPVMLKAFFNVPSFAPAIENPKIVSAVKRILGEDVICFKGDYLAKFPTTREKEPYERGPLHVDFAIGLDTGDYCNTSPSWLNVAIYLTDMTMDHAPFTVIPGSQNYHHLEPGVDMEQLRDEAQLLFAKAGDAVMFYKSTVHAGGINFSDEMQHILFVSYRPAWARPIGRVAEWPKAFVRKASGERLRLIKDLNRGVYQGRRYGTFKHHWKTRVNRFKRWLKELAHSN